MRKTKGSFKATDTVALTTGGRVTVPSEIRAKLGLLPGDKLTFSLSNGDLVMRKVIANSEQNFNVIHHSSKSG